MDRALPLCMFVGFYTISAAINAKLTKPPEYLPAKDYRDYQGQYVSILHSYMSVMLGLVVYIVEGGMRYEDPTSVLEVVAISNSLGYFIYDSIYAELFQIHDWPMRFHHLGALMACLSIFLSQMGGSVSMLGLVLTEISNPCILKRNLLKAEMKEETQEYVTYETMFAVLFILARVVIGTWYLLGVWGSSVNLVYKLTCCALYAVSLFWVFIILMKVVKKLKLNYSEGLLGWVAWGMFWIRHHKNVLLLSILVLSLAMPIIVTQVIRAQPARIYIDNFCVL